jgi:hypothetical protein
LAGERVLFDEVLLDRLVGRRGEKGGLSQKLGLERQEIPENPGKGHDHVDPRAAKLFERDQVRPREPAEAVEAGPRPDQGQRLGDRVALGLEVVGPPEHQGDGFGEAVAVGQMPFNEPR